MIGVAPLKAAQSTHDFLDEALSRKIERSVLGEVVKGLETEYMPLNKFVAESWRIVEPSNAFIDNWHIDCISEHLEAVTMGDIRRLVINIYPRVGKSLLASTIWPVWAWTQRPWLKQIFLSYSGRLSEKFSRDRRTLIESNWFQTKWGNRVQLASDQNKKTEFENTARGGMFSTSIGGTLTGEGGDVIVIDDGIDPERAESKADREAAQRFVKNTVNTRLNDMSRGAIVEISQRTHKNDISGTLLAEGGYTHLNLPAVARKKTIIFFPITKREIVREEGEPLFPARHTKEQLEDTMKRLTPRAKSAQFDQNPSSDESATFKRDNWKFYRIPPADMQRQMELSVQSWDLAFKDLNTSDFVAGGAMGQKGMDFYLFDVIHQRMGFGASKMALKSFSAKWPTIHKKLIEDKANGPAVIEESKKEVGGIEAVSPVDSKEARAAVVAAYQESGNCYLPDPSMPGCSWVNDFMEECAEFPNGEFDDQVDMFTQGVLWFLNRRKLNQQRVTVIG